MNVLLIVQLEEFDQVYAPKRQLEVSLLQYKVTRFEKIIWSTVILSTVPPSHNKTKLKEKLNNNLVFSK